MFGENFVWGVASSSYQIEGLLPDDDRGECIWDAFSRNTPEKTRGDNGLKACDHVNRYKEDFAIMKELGIKNYRFSVNWCRIIPKGTGEISKKGIELYRNMILEMKQNGIEPFLTLYHWELPQALEEKGGWLNPDIVDAFGEYARVIAENFSDICENFYTINEPQCVVGLGYCTGVHAPGKQLEIKDTLQIAHNLLKAHGTAVKALRKYSVRNVKIGYAPTCTIPLPVSNNPLDVDAARKKFFKMKFSNNWAWNIPWFADPVLLGHYPEEGLIGFKDYLPEITEEDMELIHQPLDFVGFNIYNGYYIKGDEEGNIIDVKPKKGYSETAVNWMVQDDCLYWGSKFAYERYHLPIYITENGMASCDWVALDGKVHDPARIDFLDRYLSKLQQAVDEGIDIRGYFLWTFMDNFEWDQGYHGRYGIVFTDFETMDRIPKDSAYWYKEVMESNGAILTINKKPELMKKTSYEIQRTQIE